MCVTGRVARVFERFRFVKPGKMMGILTLEVLSNMFKYPGAITDSLWKEIEDD